MFPAVPEDFEWPEQWRVLEGSQSAGFVRELHKELCPQHPFYGVLVCAVATRYDCDDVLFATVDPLRPFAVIHLTWTGGMERDPRWPSAVAFKSWDDFVAYAEANE